MFKRIIKGHLVLKFHDRDPNKMSLKGIIWTHFIFTVTLAFATSCGTAKLTTQCRGLRYYLPVAYRLFFLFCPLLPLEIRLAHKVTSLTCEMRRPNSVTKLPQKMWTCRPWLELLPLRPAAVRLSLLGPAGRRTCGAGLPLAAVPQRGSRPRGWRDGDSRCWTRVTN